MIRLRKSLFLAVITVACSSSLGSAGEDLPAEGVMVQVPCADPDDVRPVDRCPDLQTLPSQTARETVEALRPVARAIEGVGSRWTGRLGGRRIAATGRPASRSGAGWFTSFCQGDDVVWFDVTEGRCRLRNLCGCRPMGTCGGVACSGEPEPALPAVDSDRAIRSAFSEDDGTATYDLDYDARKGRWTVTRTSDGSRVEVDATTGSRIP